MLLVLGIEALLGVALSLVRRPSATEKQARVEIRAKKIELRRKRDPSLFVEASKLERRIIALEKSLATSKASREAKTAVWDNAAVWVERLLWVLTVLWCSNEPVLRVSSFNVMGLSRLLTVGADHVPGWIGAPVGIYLLQRGARRSFTRILSLNNDRSIA